LSRSNSLLICGKLTLLFLLLAAEEDDQGEHDEQKRKDSSEEPDDQFNWDLLPVGWFLDPLLDTGATVGSETQTLISVGMPKIPLPVVSVAKTLVSVGSDVLVSVEDLWVM
jgi:hypothetical protein